MGVLALGRNTLAYAFGGLAYKGIAILSVPLLARLLSPADLGLLDLAAILATVLGLAAGLGTEQGVAYLEPRVSRNGEVWNAALAVVATLAVLVALGCLLFQEPLAQILTGDRRNREVMAAAGLYGGIMAVSALALNAIRLRGSPRAYAAISFVLFSVELGAAVVVALVISQPVVWMVLAWAFGATLVVGPVLFRYLPRLGRPSWATISNLIRFGAPLVPVAIAWLLGDAWMRITLARDADLSSVGQYGIAYRLTSVMGLAVTGFGVAWHPYLYRSSASLVGLRIHTVGPSLLLAVGALGVALTALAPELVAVVAGPGYANAMTAVPALSGGMAALALFVLMSPVVGRSGSTRRVGASALLGMLVQILLAMALIRPLGVAGAGLASLGGYAIASVVLLTSERGLLAGRIGSSLAVAGIAVGIGIAISAQAVLQPIALRFALVAAFAVLAVVLARVLRPSGTQSSPLEGQQP